MANRVNAIDDTKGLGFIVASSKGLRLSWLGVYEGQLITSHWGKILELVNHRTLPLTTSRNLFFRSPKVNL